MSQPSSQNLCCTSWSAVCFWAAAFFVFYGVGLLVAFLWPALRNHQQGLLLIAMGLACLVNFARNRTFHCAITGPLFLLAAAAAGLKQAGLLQIPTPVLWGVVLVGIGVALLIEQLWVRGPQT